MWPFKKKSKIIRYSADVLQFQPDCYFVTLFYNDSYDYKEIVVQNKEMGMAIADFWCKNGYLCTVPSDIVYQTKGEVEV